MVSGGKVQQLPAMLQQLFQASNPETPQHHPELVIEAVQSIEQMARYNNESVFIQNDLDKKTI